MVRTPEEHSADSRRGRLVAEARSGEQVGPFRAQPGSTLATADRETRKRLLRWLKDEEAANFLYEQDLLRDMT